MYYKDFTVSINFKNIINYHFLFYLLYVLTDIILVITIFVLQSLYDFYLFVQKVFMVMCPIFNLRNRIKFSIVRSILRRV